MSSNNTKIAWGDLETGGLNGRLESGLLGMETYPILELAFILTDSQLNQIGEPLHIVIGHSEEVIKTCHDWAITKHTKSGLLNEVRKSKISLPMAESMVIAWLKSLGVNSYDRKSRTGAIFAGNSIMFDRDFIQCQMPTLHDYMHYRQMDISAVALAARLWNPSIEGLVNKEYKHEALADINESISEARVYKNFLFSTEASTPTPKPAIKTKPNRTFIQFLHNYQSIEHCAQHLYKKYQDNQQLQSDSQEIAAESFAAGFAAAKCNYDQQQSYDEFKQQLQLLHQEQLSHTDQG